MSGALRSFLISALFALLSVCACSAEPFDRSVGYGLCARTGVFRTDAGLLRVCAPLSSDITQSVRESVTDADRVILVTSGGGDQVDALELASIIRERNLTVRVQQFCMSACSTYLMTLAPRVEVAPYTVVAFHHTAAWLVDALAAREGMAVDAPFRQASERERAAFRAAGLDDQILDQIASSIEPLCVRETQGEQGPVANVVSRYAWYIPDRESARLIYGDRISGAWTDDPQLAVSILRTTIGQPNVRVKYGSLSSGDVSPEAVGPALPDC